MITSGGFLPLTILLFISINQPLTCVVSPRNIQRIPVTSSYRTDVEKWCNFFTNVATKSTDVKVIEKEIALGQIEETIEMLKNELKLVDIYYESKGWEAVADESKRADTMMAAMADSIYFSSPASAPAPPPTPK